MELTTNNLFHKVNHFCNEVKKELSVAYHAENKAKDILIVLKDQLEYFQVCVDSIYKHTENFNLYIWDNDSSQETKDYLKSIESDTCFVHYHDTNEGFIKPNNYLASLGNSPYVILLNSDTVVLDKWDLAMTGWLDANPEIAQVGYMGAKLDKACRGSEGGFGSDVHYICGWCFCVPRTIYQKYGLFDEENLEFAYCEDSDFSLRLQQAGHQIYSLHLDLVMHFGHKTVKEVAKTRNCETTFQANHEYLKSKWGNYVAANTDGP